MTNHTYTPVLPELERLQNRPELYHLNTKWVLDTSYDRPQRGPLAPLRRKLRALVGRAVISVLALYLLDEREFLSNLVRLQNELVRQIEALQSETRLLAQAMQAESSRLEERDETLHRLLEERITSLTSGEPKAASET